MQLIKKISNKKKNERGKEKSSRRGQNNQLMYNKNRAIRKKTKKKQKTKQNKRASMNIIFDDLKWLTSTTGNK